MFEYGGTPHFSRVRMTLGLSTRRGDSEKPGESLVALEGRLVTPTARPSRIVRTAS